MLSGRRESTQLVVEVRALRLDGDASVTRRLAHKAGYVKLHLDGYEFKTEAFVLEPSWTGVDEVCTFRLQREAMSQDSVLDVRLKTLGPVQMFRLKPGKSKHVAGVAAIKLAELARIGSPENVVAFPLSLDSDATTQVGEIELAVYWCRSAELPTSGTAEAQKRKARRVIGGVLDHANALGLKAGRRCTDWVDNKAGVANLDAYSKLRVAVIEARGLRAADSNGLSDPYCIVSCKGTRHKTAIIKKTLSPLWDESFAFSAIDNIDANDEVHFIVRDSDKFSRDDDLGELVVPLWALLRDGSLGKAMWYDLVPTPRMKTWSPDKPLGAMRIQVDFRERTSPAPAVSRIANQAVSTKPLLFLRVIQARSLIAADANGFSDPYCTVRCKRKSQSTRTVKRTLDPKWNQVFRFGDKDYLADTDVVTLTVFDKDFGVLEGVSDDKLGQVDIPIALFKSLGANPAPLWFRLESDKFANPGEIQVSARYVEPSSHTENTKARKLYKGKEWLYEVHVAVLSAQGLRSSLPDRAHAANPFCRLRCGAHSAVSTRVQRNTINPIWNQKFKFRKSVDSSRYGLGRMDPLHAEVHDEGGVPIGKVDLDLGQVLDELGYVDKQGATTTREYVLEPMSSNLAEDDMHLDDHDIGGEDPQSPSSPGSTRSHGGRLSSLSPSPFLRRALRRVGSPSSMLGSQSGSRRNSEDPDTDNELDHGDDFEMEAKDQHPGQLRGGGGGSGGGGGGGGSGGAAAGRPLSPTALMSSQLMGNQEKGVRRIVNVSDQALNTTRSLLNNSLEAARERDLTQLRHAIVNATGTVSSIPSDSLTDPGFLDAGKLRLRIHIVPIGELRMVERSKLSVQVCKLADITKGACAPKGDPRLPATLRCEVRFGLEAQRTPETTFRNHSGGVASINHTLIFDDFDLGPLVKAASDTKAKALASKAGNPSLHITVTNASSDEVVATKELPMTHLPKLLQSRVAVWLPLDPGLYPDTTPKVQLQLRALQMVQEMRPIIGRFHLSLINLKVKRDNFEHTYRTVIRYNDKTIATRGVTGKLSFNYDVARHTYNFSVHDMFSRVIIELWMAKNPLPSAATGARMQPKNASEEAESATKWGKYCGAAVITVFDMLELEAQMVYAEKSLTKQATWPSIKLPIMKGGRLRATLWLQAMYEEDIGEVTKPNPNPEMRPPRPFSLANIRHEANRTAAIVSWFTQVGGGVQHLLNWENKAHTLLAILLAICFCCLDTFSERILALPMWYLLGFVVRKHNERMTGALVQAMMTDARVRATKARFRVSIVRARGLLGARPSTLHRNSWSPPILSLGGASEQASPRSLGSPNTPGSPASPTSPASPASFNSPMSAGGSPGTPGSQSSAGGSTRFGRSRAEFFDAFTPGSLRRASPPQSLRRSAKAIGGVITRMRRAQSSGKTHTVSSPGHRRVASAGPRLGHPSGYAGPAARAKVSFRARYGAGHAAALGFTRTSLPSAAPDWSSRMLGHELVKRHQGLFATQVAEWYTGSGTVPSFQADVPLVPVDSRRILVKLYRAESLPVGDAGGSSDPFVQLQTVSAAGPSNVLRSKTVKCSLNPEWNQRFVIGASSLFHDTDFLEVLVFDADALSRDLLAKWSIQVGKLASTFSLASEKREPVWINLHEPTTGFDHVQLPGKLAGSFGRILLDVQVLDFGKETVGSELLRSEQLPAVHLWPGSASVQPVSFMELNSPGTSPRGSFSAAEDDGTANEDNTQEKQDHDEGTARVGAGITAPDSWFRCGSELIVDVEDQSAADSVSAFLGSARLPMAALVEDEENREQPVVERWLPLSFKMDGSEADRSLAERARIAGRDDLGEVLVRVKVVLPDPGAKERLMELEDAKRADKAGPIARLRMMNQRLDNLQSALYSFNNKMEHLKNLFNWSHPQKTRVVSQLLLVLAVLFTLVPSRFIVLFVALFMFTEHFRPMGTMSLRLNHLLALLPTDDDLREACAGGIVNAKRKTIHPSGGGGIRRVPSYAEQMQTPTLLADVLPPGMTWVQLRGDVSVGALADAAILTITRAPKAAIVDLQAEDIENGFTGHLRVLGFASTTFSSSRPRWTTMYFFLHPTTGGLSCWASRELFDADSPPLAHLPTLVAVDTRVEPPPGSQSDTLHGCNQLDNAFALFVPRAGSTSPDTLHKLVFVANSAAKKAEWVRAVLRFNAEHAPSQQHPHEAI